MRTFLIAVSGFFLLLGLMILQSARLSYLERAPIPEVVNVSVFGLLCALGGAGGLHYQLLRAPLAARRRAAVRNRYAQEPWRWPEAWRSTTRCSEVVFRSTSMLTSSAAPYSVRCVAANSISTRCLSRS